MIGPIMVDVEGLSLTDDDREVLAHPLTGGVILFARNYADKEQLKSLVAQIKSIKSPSLIVSVDQEGGRVQRFRDSFTRIPPMRHFGDWYERAPLLALQCAEDCGWVLGSELREMDIDLDFAPVIDLDYGVSDVIGDRSFSSEPNAVLLLAQALINGLHSAGVSSCIKHFPGHGAVTADSHHELPVDERGRDQIERDLIPFRALASRARSVMTAHLIARCEDEELVSFSRHWINGVLREELSFKGVVFSDDLSMKGADCEGGITAKVDKALSAGCQFLPICNDRASVNELFATAPDYRGSAQLNTLRSVFPSPKNIVNTKRYMTFEKLIVSEFGDEYGR